MTNSLNDIKFTHEDDKDNQVIFHISVGEKFTDNHLKIAYKKIANRLNIPGFRKGKAPYKIVEQFVGREYLMEESLETLIPKAVGDVLQNTEISIANTTPRVSIVEREPLKIDAIVALIPTVKIGSLAKMKFADKAEDITKKDIDNQITQILDSQSKWDDVKRKSKYGDMVNLTYKSSIDGEEFLNSDKSDFPLEENSPNPLLGFSSKIIGLVAGDKKSFKLEVPKDYFEKKFSEKQSLFDVEIFSVKEKVLPNLDDKFVSSIAQDISTVKEFKSRIKQNLKLRSEENLKRILEDKILDYMIGNSKFEISPMIIEQSANNSMEEQEKQFSQYNINYDQYLSGVGKSREEILEETKKTSEINIKKMLVLEEYTKNKKINVSDKDINKEIDLLKTNPQYKGMDFNSENVRESVRENIKRQKGIDDLISLSNKKTISKTKKSKKVK
ncbi:MAG: trigger factor [Dehalococcoidia bacterium]